MPNIVINKTLYERVKSQAKRKFKVWPSAYASAWLVKEYKKRGGTYKISKSKLRFGKAKSKKRGGTYKISKSKSRGRKSKSGLSRWFLEKWIDVCELPKIVPCGRKNASNSKRQYPYCRPLRKITSKSPTIVRSLTKHDIKKRCRSKRRNPSKKIY